MRGSRYPIGQSVRRLFVARSVSYDHNALPRDQRMLPMRRPRRFGLKGSAYAVAGVAQLLFASRHTLPLHGALSQHPFIAAIAALQILTTFALAGLCFALARTANGDPIDIPLIGAGLGAHSIVISLLHTAAFEHTGEAVIGAFLASCGAILGAVIAEALAR